MFDPIQKSRDLGLYILDHTISTYALIEDIFYWQVGISHSVRDWFPILSKNPKAIFFCILPVDFDKSLFIKNSEILVGLSNDLASWDPRHNFVLLANTPAQKDFAMQAGFINSIFCNNNCFLDWNLYGSQVDSISEDNRIYDLVINCRPEGWKRPHFAKGISNLAIIKGYQFRPNDYFELESLNPKFINSDKRLSEKEVATILCQSKTGGIFSETEGACWSSSEYLLCGLPVVSSRSSGGRDIWYDDDNSIIVETADDVYSAVNTLIERASSTKGYRSEIRKKHISLATQMRERFISQGQRLLSEQGINVDFRKTFNTRYRNKMNIWRPRENTA